MSTPSCTRSPEPVDRNQIFNVRVRHHAEEPRSRLWAYDHLKREGESRRTPDYSHLDPDDFYRIKTSSAPAPRPRKPATNLVIGPG